MTKWRKAICKIHLWIALTLFVPFILSGLTGSIMVFKNEILTAFEEKMPEFKDNHQSYSISQIIHAAEKEVPENYFPSIYKTSYEVSKPAIVRFSSKDKSEKPKTIYIDPISLQASEKNPDEGIFRQIFLLRSTLLIKDFGGKSIVGWFGVALLLMSISGLIIWWPKLSKLKSAITFKFSSKEFNFYYSLHKSLGFWSFIFLIITSVSGIYLAFPKPVSAMAGSIFPVRDFKGDYLIIKEDHQQKTLPLEQIIEIARSASHSENIASINFGAKPISPYKISLFPENYQKNHPLISVFINPYDGSVLEIFNPKNYSLGENFLIWQHTIHQGSGFGLWWSIPVFLVGFLPLIFSITGLKMWLLKRKNRFYYSSSQRKLGSQYVEQDPSFRWDDE